MSFLKIWSSLSQAYVRRQVSGKLGSNCDKCFLAEYPKEAREHYINNSTEGKVFIARTTVFQEREFMSKGISRKNSKKFNVYKVAINQWRNESKFRKLLRKNYMLQ